MTTHRVNLLDNETSYKETVGIKFLKTYQSEGLLNEHMMQVNEKLTLVKSVINSEMSSDELRYFLTK
jgi:hypothetical protein